MKICLETSSIIGFLKGEPDYQPIERLLTLAETGQVEFFVSDFAKVAHLEEWVLGEDVLGHDDSAEIESTLSKASRPDREQFLSYAALSLDFFVTKDKHYLKKTMRSKLVKQYGFQVGTPDECVNWIEHREVY